MVSLNEEVGVRDISSVDIITGKPILRKREKRLNWNRMIQQYQWMPHDSSHREILQVMLLAKYYNCLAIHSNASIEEGVYHERNAESPMMSRCPNQQKEEQRMRRPRVRRITCKDAAID